MTAARRRAVFDQRMAVAPTDREQRHALVWWWLSEIRKQPVERQVVEFARLLALVEAMSGARPAVTVGECHGAMPTVDASLVGGPGAPPGISASARGQHTTAPAYVTDSDVNRPALTSDLRRMS